MEIRGRGSYRKWHGFIVADDVESFLKGRFNDRAKSSTPRSRTNQQFSAPADDKNDFRLHDRRMQNCHLLRDP